MWVRTRVVLALRNGALAVLKCAQGRYCYHSHVTEAKNSLWMFKKLV